MGILLVATLTIVVIYYLRQKDYVVGKEFNNLVQLRKMLELCTKHRSITHKGLCGKISQVEASDLDQIYTQLHELSDSSIAKVPSDIRPMYRTFQAKLEQMHLGWQERETSRNQVTHGQAIRHCMYLIDEATQALLVKTEQSQLSEQYHQHWQKVFDCMDALTELRLCIIEVKSSNGQLRVKRACGKLNNKIEQLATASPKVLTEPNTRSALDNLVRVANSDDINMSEAELYALTTGISATIIQGYDQILYAVTDELCRPIPRMWLV